tara:strand:- start:81 stop:638 length:558 start_codon:yes stop_codon:yes gene_type:complete
MLENILHYDHKLFMFINIELSNAIFDFIMPLFDNPKKWLIPILLLWIIGFIKDKKNRYKLLIMIPLVVLLTDQFGAFIKNFELRDRPWYAFGTDEVNHLGGKGGKHKSFPSNHAANLSALATVFTYIYYKQKYIFWLLALIIMFSRIYIGVHFPLDVFTGMIIGTIFGLILISLSINWARYHQEP